MQIPLEHDVPDKTFALNPFSIEGAEVTDEERSPAADISAASMTRLRSPFAAEEPARERGPESTAR
ncbi:MULTISPECIES: hypothetical protein [Micromonospora]|uniref:Uncharacterized protein n=1 Tax=Micromonospora chalcea TaxID=1874 RepID=A0ABX9Y8R0_MICCH|nr:MULTISPECIES: hypothetical protein [Micromonospora]MBP1780624.1 hypothetical protein [Micromonospora sp. HB375]MBQ1060878.1 hypothetical protein [Micromonospora sp. C41]MDH6468848.1 hypothetical protein [Micromonospora sp. H404/HB375]ODB80174.1 hypothetical protein A8711_21965 [Micromonospora sp. II]RQW96474.1 hypothetical protein DLJ60_04640 [Micromonospora chalcea]